MADDILSSTLVIFPGVSGQQQLTDNNTAYTIESGEPFDGDFRSSWFLVQAGDICDITVHVDASNPSYTFRLSAFVDEGGNLLFADLVENDTAVDASTITFRQHGNISTVVRFAGLDDAGTGYTITFTATPSTFIPTGDPGAFTNPYKISTPNDTTAYVSPALSNTSFPQSMDGAPAGYYPVWFLFVPAADGNLALDTQLGTQTLGTELELYQGADFVTDTRGSITLLQQEFGSPGGPYSQIFQAVTAGTAYWIRVASADTSETFDYVLRAQGVASAGYGTGVVVIPADTVVDLELPGLGTVRVDAPPADTATSLGGRLTKIIIAPPIATAIGPRATTSASIRRVLGRPSDGDTVPVDEPQLTVGVQVTEGEYDVIGVDVQYDTAGQLGTSSPILSTQVSGSINVSLATFFTPALGNVSYQWRARLVVDGTPKAWTTARTFIVDNTGSDAVCPVQWNVTTATTSPQLWSVDPAGGVPGQAITLYGQGLPDTPIVRIANVSAAVVSVTHVPATAAASTPDRTLADVEHHEIVVTVPAINAPGGPLIIEGTY